MSQPTQAPCTNSDPDIAGVGVRLAFFLQALLTFVAPTLAIIDGTIDDSRSKRMFGLSMENVFLSGALVLTATVKLAQRGLSAYHALVLLQMTWALEGPLVLSYPLLDQFLDRFAGGLAVDFLVNPRTAMPLYFFRFFHGVFGITVWTLISVRSKALKCTGETFLLPGRTYIREGWVQGIFLLLYAFRVVHAVHTVVWALWRQPVLGKDVHPSIMGTRMAIAGLIWIWLFVLTWKLVEKSVQANVVADGESSWGFGQILPLVLVLSHGRRVWKVFRQWQQRRTAYMNETRETELVVRPFRDLTARPVNSVPVAEGRESTAAVAVPSGVDRRDGLTRRPTARRRVNVDKDFPTPKFPTPRVLRDAFEQFRLRRKADAASQEPLLPNKGEDDGLQDGRSRARLAGNHSNSDGESHSGDLSYAGRDSMDGAHAKAGASEEPNENGSVRKSRRADSGADGDETHELKELRPVLPRES